jgi:hypothetical protein
VTRFVVRATFEAPGSAATGLRLDPLRPGWGPGHAFSALRTRPGRDDELVVWAVVRAGSRDAARAVVTAAALRLAPGVVASPVRPCGVVARHAAARRR